MKHVVFIGLVIPEPASTAAGKRMMQLISLFEEQKFKITFLTAAGNMEFSEKINFIKIELNSSTFDRLIRELNPDFVVFDRYVTEEQFGWRVSENCPGAVKILDTEDLHFLREARRKAFSNKRNFEEKDLYNSIFTREMASVLRCDLSLIISEFEARLLTDKFNLSSSLLFYLPFLWDGIPNRNADFETRKNFVSIGNFLHEPNWQTVLKLKKLWKHIRKKNQTAQLHIYGSYATEKVYSLHNEKEGFIVKGRAGAVQETFNNYRVLLAPIPFGAGLKGKIFESMMYGLPNVTTGPGAEGFKENELWNGFVEDCDENFIEKSVLLYQNQEIWEFSQENGYKILHDKFAKTDFEDIFLKKLYAIHQNLTAHRHKNFLGQILLHHTLNSVKYMSRWIEEKNRKI